jgi:cyclopropane fatty-acyl-phospholipid synthase-like methyltransferase
VSAFRALIRPDRYPLSSRYDPRWVIALEMGPHPLWQLEDILPALALKPGSLVLDLGCGRGATSVFLARECGVTVTACDLLVRVEELAAVFREAGVERSVTAVNADVRQLPFADDEFDAIVSIDAFEYFGTDVHLLPALLRVLKSGGTVGITTPGFEPAWLPDGRENWIRWVEAVQSVSGEGEAAVLDLLEGETGVQMGFVSVTARTR